MNKILKRSLLIIAIIIAVFVLTFGGIFLKLNYEMSGFSPMETGQVMDNIFVVKDGFANIFIIQDGTQYIVIDGGMDKKTTESELKKLNIMADDVKYLFLTHTDSDHIGASSLFGNAKLFVAKEELPMINGERTKFVRMFGNPKPRSDFIFLEDREVVQAGNYRIQGILAPGHTTGTMAYLVNDKYLFTGDILSLNDGKIAAIPKFFDMDHAQAVQSLEIIQNIPTAEFIFTAHWGYTDDFQKAIAFD